MSFRRETEMEKNAKKQMEKKQRGVGAPQWLIDEACKRNNDKKNVKY